MTPGVPLAVPLFPPGKDPATTLRDLGYDQLDAQRRMAYAESEETRRTSRLEWAVHWILSMIAIVGCGGALLADVDVMTRFRTPMAFVLAITLCAFMIVQVLSRRRNAKVASILEQCIRAERQTGLTPFCFGCGRSSPEVRWDCCSNCGARLVSPLSRGSGN